ncbi:MAG TPA: homoserine dehydrogenase [Vicinamibacterales bacterium]|nr:homoserine dehydrogenase [Vicinamibacterales bacterium]
MVLDLVLIGFGHVSRRFVQLLHEREDRLAREEDLRVRVVGIATGRHGCLRAPAGDGAVDVDRALACLAEDRPLAAPASPDACRDSFSLIADAAAHSRAAAERRLVVVEATLLDIRQGQPAIDHVEAALAAGAHVVTSNKGPAAFAHRRLAEAARRAGRCFLFEGAVMDGIPVFNLVRETLPVTTITAFRGVVNSTTNHVLTAMEEGRAFGDALAEMQAAGIAEADPSLDIDGWDAAAKTTVLANVLMGGSLTPQEVARTGIAGVSRDDVRSAMARGCRIRLVASAVRRGDRIAATVAPAELPERDLLAGLRGGENALAIETDLLGELVLVQRASGLTQTAYALLADLVTIARRLRMRS